MGLRKFNACGVARCGKDARKADNVIFYWNTGNKLSLLHEAVVREVGRLCKKESLQSLPDIYYMDAQNQLKLFWQNNKEAPFEK
jgi:hypothetical protein